MLKIVVTKPSEHEITMQTTPDNGVRYMPVRQCLITGRTYLDTERVTYSADAALRGARDQEAWEYGPEWAELNPLLGIAEVLLFAVRQINICDIETAVTR